MSKSQQILENIKIITLLLFLAYGVIYIAPLDFRPLSIPDETRYAEIPREMIASGDWIVPHLVDLRYFEKPVLGYWLNAISISVFGENNFAVRLPTALSMGISAWFIWLLLVRTGHGPRVALAASAVYLTLVEVMLIGTIAILDSPFSMFLTGGMVLFYLGTVENNTVSRQRWLLAGSGVMFGLAFLTKGFLAFAIPGIVLLPFILITKNYQMLWRSLWIILFTAITIAPWSIAIHIREPDFWHYFIWEEHIRRFLSDTAQHAAPFYYYFISLPVVAFPWLGFLPAAVVGHYNKAQKTSLYWFLILWSCIPLLFFSISSGKLISYILPCMVPFAVLIATGLADYLRSGKMRWFIFGVVVNAITIATILIALFYSEYSTANKPLYVQSEFSKFVIITGALSITLILTITSTFIKSIYLRFTLLVCATGLLLPSINFSLPNSLLDNKSPSFIMGHVLHKVNDDTILVSDGNVVRAVAWTFRRSDILLLSQGELGYGLSYPEHANKMIGITGLKTLLEKQQSGEIKKDITVFCEEPCQESLNKLLGHHTDKMSNDEFAVWHVNAKK